MRGPMAGWDLETGRENTETDTETGIDSPETREKLVQKPRRQAAYQFTAAQRQPFSSCLIHSIAHLSPIYRR